MIFGNIENLNEYTYLDENIKKCFEYAKNNDLLSYDKGCHKIDGDNLFVNIVEYETTEQVAMVHINIICYTGNGIFSLYLSV